MGKYLSFDLEIYDDIPQEGEIDYEKVIISTAAFCEEGNDDNVKFYYDIPHMTKETAIKLVEDIEDEMKKGYIPFTWNGTSFDFRILAYNSGLIERCAEIALNSIDAMLLVTFSKGFFLSLDKALIGAGLETKRHKVLLNDGTWLESMSGQLAPKLWRDGEVKAVNSYLIGDVVQPLKLAFAIETNKRISWTSNTGKGQSVYIPEMLLVKDLFSIPEPNCSWMTNAPKRSQFFEWIPKDILEKYGIRFEKIEKNLDLEGDFPF